MPSSGSITQRTPLVPSLLAPSSPRKAVGTSSGRCEYHAQSFGAVRQPSDAGIRQPVDDYETSYLTRQIGLKKSRVVAEHDASIRLSFGATQHVWMREHSVAELEDENGVLRSENDVLKSELDAASWQPHVKHA